jgi:3-mercaptopyruvate sulfurtransferase SseA
MVNSSSIIFFSNYKILLGPNAGHLPNSLNISYTEVFDQTNQCLKSNDELKKRKYLTK